MSLAQQLLIPHYGKEAIPWWLAAGVTPIAAYQAKGVASYAASKINLVTPGTYDLTEGNGAVTWSSVAGWQFTAAQNKYFDTGIVPTNVYSTFVQFSGADGSAATTLFGQLSIDLSGRYYINTSALYANGGLVTTTQTLAGNLGIAGQGGYLNGAIDKIIPAGGVPQFSIYIGARHVNGGVDRFITANIQSLIVYSSTLTSPQVALLAAAMAAL